VKLKILSPFRENDLSLIAVRLSHKKVNFVKEIILTIQNIVSVAIRSDLWLNSKLSKKSQDLQPDKPIRAVYFWLLGLIINYCVTHRSCIPAAPTLSNNCNRILFGDTWVKPSCLVPSSLKNGQTNFFIRTYRIGLGVNRPDTGKQLAVRLGQM